MSETFSVPVPGGTIAGETAGEGMAVVLLHAGVADRRIWTRQIEELNEAGYRAIAYDRRGYGETVVEEAGRDHRFDPVEDLAMVLDALGEHAAVFVGNSMGGALALEFALEHPGRVIGLVLVGTAISGAPGDLAEPERFVAHAEEDAEERGDVETLVRVRAHSWLDGPRTPGGRVTGEARALFELMNRTALVKPPVGLPVERDPVWPRLEAISAPTLLVCGDEDYLYQLDWHEHLSETMPNAFAVVLEGTAHLPSLEKPELFNDLLLEFLETIEGGGGDGDDSDDEDEGEADDGDWGDIDALE